MADLLRVMELSPGASSVAASRFLSQRRVHSGESLVHEGAPAHALYFVVGGSFKVFHTNIDGYEQVLAFAYRGDVLGFDALCMKSHPSAITALEESSVCVVLRSEVAELCQSVPAFSEALQRAGSRSLVHSRELTDLMAAVAAEVRLARFLVQVSERMAAAGQSPTRIRLSMGRREVASLLGVAHETVSRSFTSLSAARLLTVCDREVEIKDVDRLRAFSRCTRRRGDDGMHQLTTPSLPITRASGSRRPSQDAPGRYRTPAMGSYAGQKALAA